MKYFELIKFLNDNNIDYDNGFYYNNDYKIIGGWIHIDTDFDFNRDDEYNK